MGELGHSGGGNNTHTHTHTRTDAHKHLSMINFIALSIIHWLEQDKPPELFTKGDLPSDRYNIVRAESAGAFSTV